MKPTEYRAEIERLGSEVERMRERADYYIGNRQIAVAENGRIRALLARILPLLPKDYSWIQLAKDIHAAIQGQAVDCAEHDWSVDVVRDANGHWQADALKDRLIECRRCGITASEEVGGGR